MSEVTAWCVKSTKTGLMLIQTLSKNKGRPTLKVKHQRSLVGNEFNDFGYKEVKVKITEVVE